eukprot:sb/3478292/
MEEVFKRYISVGMEDGNNPHKGVPLNSTKIREITLDACIVGCVNGWWVVELKISQPREYELVGYDTRDTYRFSLFIYPEMWSDFKIMYKWFQSTQIKFASVF